MRPTLFRHGATMRSLLVLPLCALAFLALGVAPSGAQTVRGSVYDADAGVPIYTVEVALLDDDDHVVAVTGSARNGDFVLNVPRSGRYRIRAARIGYTLHTTDAFALEAGQEVVADLRLQPDPILLAPIEATVAAAQDRHLKRVGFYRRKEFKGSYGYFRDEEELAALKPVFMYEVFAGLPVFFKEKNPQLANSAASLNRGWRHGCALGVIVDGTLLLGDWTDFVSPTDIAAIEVYPTIAGVPAWVPTDIRRCGAVLIWTKSGKP